MVNLKKLKKPKPNGFWFRYDMKAFNEMIKADKEKVKQDDARRLHL